MRWIVLTSAAMLCACSNTGEAAEKRYEMVKRTGTLGEICDAGKAVAGEYLKSGDEHGYKFWHMLSEADCLSAKLLGRSSNPDVMLNTQ